MGPAPHHLCQAMLAAKQGAQQGCLLHSKLVEYPLPARFASPVCLGSAIKELEQYRGVLFDGKAIWRPPWFSLYLGLKSPLLVVLVKALNSLIAKDSKRKVEEKI